jgi:hypothetical protein
MEAWCAADDVLLRDAVDAGASLHALACGAVTFSRLFSEDELAARWRALLFDPAACTAAVARWEGVQPPAQPAPPQYALDTAALLAASRGARRAAARAEEAAAPAPGFGGVGGVGAVPADDAPGTFSEARAALGAARGAPF